MTATAARATCASFSHCVRAAESRKSPQNSDFYGHRTTYSEKAHCIKDSVLLDPFGGSGSTLIAANQLKRKARLIELERHYVDVIVRRYLEDTGEILDAYLVRDGKTIPLSEIEYFKLKEDDYEN